MKFPTTIALTTSQISALECSALIGEREDEEADFPALAQAWSGTTLTVGDREAAIKIGRELTDMANSEDDIAEDRTRDKESRTLARGARTALCNLNAKLTALAAVENSY